MAIVFLSSVLSELAVLFSILGVLSIYFYSHYRPLVFISMRLVGLWTVSLLQTQTKVPPVELWKDHSCSF